MNRWAREEQWTRVGCNNDNPFKGDKHKPLGSMANQTRKRIRARGGRDKRGEDGKEGRKEGGVKWVKESENG